MNDEDDLHVPGLPRKRKAKTPADSKASSPSYGTVVVTSALTAVVVAVATVMTVGRVRPAMLASSPVAPSTAPASAVAPSVSAAVASVVVPDLARIPAENVRAIVEAMGLRAIVNERREPSAVPEGLVAAQAPRAGSRVERGGDVAVVISSGPAQPTPQPASAQPTSAQPASAEGVVLVPSVYRLREPQARAVLSAAGLVLGAHRRARYDEDVSPGRILRQSPAAGARVARGTAVDVWVNEE